MVITKMSTIIATRTKSQSYHNMRPV